jgi:site-specific DNA-methyltransferase (adenine-specific)/modification methylase
VFQTFFWGNGILQDTQTFLDGRITLIHGDSLELLAQGAFNPIDAIITDPPYGIGYQHSGGGNKGVHQGCHSEKILGDDHPFDPAPWLELAKASGRERKNYSLPVAFFGAEHFAPRLPEGRLICWDKSCGMGATDSFSDAEFIWTNRRSARNVYRHLWKGCTRQGMDRAHPRRHVSQKPTELMMWLIETCRVGVDKLVLDPFMGSGSTGVACILTGRRFIGVDADAKIFADAVARMREAAASMTIP